MKGIILAGGKGSRLNPATLAISKHLLPIYDKPMIYYPLSTLMLADIKEILLISTSQDLPRYKLLLDDGSQWGINISYAVQEEPKGIVDALLIGERFINYDKTALILGDNIFYGNKLSENLQINKEFIGAKIFTAQVKDTSRYGIIEFDKNDNPIRLIEKPKNTNSNHAITGLYYFDNQVFEIAKTIRPSSRKELEILDVHKVYLQNKKLDIHKFGRGYAWLDTGTHESLLSASQFVATIETRQGLKISCPEEIAFRNGFIDSNQLKKLSIKNKNSTYGDYLKKVLKS